MRAMIPPCTSNLLMDGRRQELPYLSDIIQFNVDYLQVLLICSVILSLTSNHEPRLRTAELTNATVA